MQNNTIKAVSTPTKLISWTLIYLLSVNPFIHAVAQGIQVDGNAAAKNQATLDSAANGVPVVNIANPSARGVSHNKFKHFNVGASGVVINNSRQIIRTQLAGFIAGNSNLNTSASIILNEVTHANPSQLLGYTEIAGPSARYILANPYGITCNGCGFINTPHSTLATGTPSFLNGDLTGFSVDGGKVAIEGLGLNANSVDRFDIFARAVSLNAAVHAQDLNIVSGRNEVAFNVNGLSESDIQAKADNGSSKPGFALDASALGSLNANQIYLIGTEQGLGVNMLGDMAATVGDITLKADGTITLNNVNATKNLTVSSVQGDVNQKGVGYAEKVDVSAAGSLVIDRQAALSADKIITVRADTLSQNGTLAAGVERDKSFNSNGGLSLDLNRFDFDSGIVATKKLQVNSSQALNLAQGKIFETQAELQLNGQQGFTNAGTLTVVGDLTVQASSLKNNDTATIASAGNSQYQITGQTINAGVITADQNLSLKGASLNNTGSFGAGHDVTVDLSGALSNTNNSLLYAGNNLALYSDTLTNHSSDIFALNDIFIAKNNQSAKNTQVDNVSGRIEVYNGNLTIDTNTLNNRRDVLNINTTQQVSALDIIDDNELFLYDPVVVSWLSSQAEGRDLSHIGPRKPGRGGAAPSKSRWASHWINLYLNRLKSIPGVNIPGATLSRLTNRVIADSNTTNNNVYVSRVDRIIDFVIADLKTSEPAQYTLIKQYLQQQLAGTVPGFDGFGTISVASDWNDTRDNHYYTRYSYLSSNVSKTVLGDASAESKLLAGSHITLKADTINNDHSSVQAGQNIKLQGNTLNNTGTQLELTAIRKTTRRGFHNGDTKDHRVSFTTQVRSLGSVDANIHAGGNISGDFSGQINNNTVKQGVTFQSPGAKNLNTDVTVQSPALQLPAGNSGLFVVNSTPNHSVLIETNPAFANANNFIGSDYLLTRLGYEPVSATRRLGDGFYETRLMRDQVFNATGKRYLKPAYASDSEQFQALMDNALAAHQSLQLSLGVALTKEQAALLSDDIIWLQEQQLAGQKVLVPTLYLADASRSKSLHQAASMRGENVTLQAANINNSGAIVATDDLTLSSAQDVTNTEGDLVAGKSLAIAAQGDIKNLSGRIQGATVALNANGNIVNKTLSQATEREGADYGVRYKAINSTVAATAQINSNAGDASLNAGNNIRLTAAELNTTGSATITAGGDIIADTVQMRDRTDARWRKGYHIEDATNHLTSSINTGGDLNLNSDRDIVLKGMQVKAEQDINLSAQRDIQIEAVANTFALNHFHKSTSGNRKTTIKASRVTHLGSHLEAGGDIRINTDAIDNNDGRGASPLKHGRDVTIVASRIEAGGDVAVRGEGDVVLMAAADEDHYFLHSKHKNGLNKSEDKIESDRITHVRSELLADKNVTVYSGGNTLLQAARIEAGSDLALITKENLYLGAVKDTDSYSEEHSDSSAVWQSQEGEGHIDETVQHTELSAEGDIEIDAQQIVVDYRTKSGQSLDAAIAELAQETPNLAYLVDLKENRPDINWQAIQETHEQWDYESEGLSGAAAAIIVIVVAMVTAGVGTAGAGASLLTTAGGTATTASGLTVAGAVANAAVTALATQASISVINNKGNLGAVFKELGSKENLKSLATSMATAGVIKSGPGLSDLSAGEIQAGADWLERGENAVYQAGLSAGVDTAINGGSLGDNLESRLTNALINWSGQELTRDIGDAELKSSLETEAGGWQKTLAHAVVGCAQARASGNDCGSGAIGGATSELLSPWLSENELGETANTSNELVIVLGSALAAGLAGKEIDTAANQGLQVERYNRQAHDWEIAAINKAAEKMSAETGVSLDVAKQKLAYELLLHIDASWNQSLTEQGVSSDQQALNYLAAELAEQGDAYAPLGNSDLPNLNDGTAIYTPEEVAHFLHAYKDNRTSAYNDRTLNGESLLAFSSVRNFYDRHLRTERTASELFSENLSGQIDGASDAAIGAVDGFKSTIGAFIDDTVGTSEEIANGTTRLVLAPDRVFNEWKEGKTEEEINNYLDRLQGDYYSAARRETRSNVENTAAVLGAITPAGRLRGAGTERTGGLDSDLGPDTDLAKVDAPNPGTRPDATDGEFVGQPFVQIQSPNNIGGTQIKTVSPDTANGTFPKPAYNPNSPIYDFKADGSTSYVRVFSEGKNEASGAWILRSEDIKGLSPSQIQQQFDLPTTPTSLVDVIPPKNTEIRTGTVNTSNFSGTGGRVQFQFLNGYNESWFTNPRALK